MSSKFNWENMLYSLEYNAKKLGENDPFNLLELKIFEDSFWFSPIKYYAAVVSTFLNALIENKPYTIEDHIGFGPISRTLYYKPDNHELIAGIYCVGIDYISNSQELHKKGDVFLVTSSEKFYNDSKDLMKIIYELETNSWRDMTKDELKDLLSKTPYLSLKDREDPTEFSYFSRENNPHYFSYVFPFDERKIKINRISKN